MVAFCMVLYTSSVLSINVPQKQKEIISSLPSNIQMHDPSIRKIIKLKILKK